MTTKFKRAANGTDVYAKIESRTIKGDTCWTWIGTHSKGYPVVRLPCNHDGGKQVAYVSRVILAKTLGRPLAKEEFACHSCDNPGCVNPSHIWAGTHKQNVADMKAKCRQLRGEQCRTSKLTETQAREIYNSVGSHRAIAAQYGVRYQSVGAIKRGIAWAHLNLHKPATTR